MSTLSSNPLPPSVATAALLKSQLDQGRDYFDLLVPFVLRGVTELSSDVVAPLELRDKMKADLGLDVPLRTIAVLLDRLAKRDGSGLVKEGSTFLRSSSTPASDTSTAVQQEFMYLGETFAAFAREHISSIRSTEDALSLLSDFLETHAATLVLDEQLPAARTGRREDIVVASFLKSRLAEDARAADACTSLVEGLVLARAVTLKDLAGLARKPSSLVVYFDTPFVLALVGLYSDPDQEASREAVGLLKALDAVPAVFDVTVSEVRRILAVYENRLDTVEGRQSLYRTPLTSFFLSRNATGADVRTHSALMLATLEREGVIVHSTPPRERECVADEAALLDALRDFRGEGYEARETHDLTD